MRINDMEPTVFPAVLPHRQAKKIATNNTVQRNEAFVSSDIDTLRQSKTSVLDIYYRMQQTRKAAKEKYDKEQPEKAVRAEHPQPKESETKTNIIVKPDGSRVLVITTMTGGMETTMSLEIAKPQAESFCLDDAEADKASEMLPEPCLPPETQHL